MIFKQGDRVKPSGEALMVFGGRMGNPNTRATVVGIPRHRKVDQPQCITVLIDGSHTVSVYAASFWVHADCQEWLDASERPSGLVWRRAMSVDDHRAFGLQSNIPECCVEEWVRMHSTDPSDHEHIWHVEQRRCIASPDCDYRPPIERMRERGLPDVDCDYIPCLACHVEIAAGVKQPNRLRECEYDASLADLVREAGGRIS